PADDWRKRNADFREPRLSRTLRLVRLLRAVGHRYGRSPAKIAVAWVLSNPAVTWAIVGARRPAQVRGVVGAAEVRLSPQDIGVIEAFCASEAAGPVDQVRRAAAHAGACGSRTISKRMTRLPTSNNSTAGSTARGPAPASSRHIGTSVPAPRQIAARRKSR